jgi:hypothetical protein
MPSLSINSLEAAMQQVRALAAAVLAATVALLVAGCGSSTASVSGEVTFDGKPVDGHITFTPADGKGKDGGGPITGGRYTVAGLPPGRKMVKVIAVRKVNFASTSEEMKQKAAEAQKAGNYDGLVDPADTIPDNAVGNNVEVELKAGDNTRDIHLK